MTVGVYNVKEAHNVRVVHLFEEGDLANCGGWDSFVFRFQADFLQGYDAASMGEVAGFVDNAVSS